MNKFRYGMGLGGGGDNGGRARSSAPTGVASPVDNRGRRSGSGFNGSSLAGTRGPSMGSVGMGRHGGTAGRDGGGGSGDGGGDGHGGTSCSSSGSGMSKNVTAKSENIDLRIIPYVEIDGTRTYSDTEIMKLFNRVVEDGIYDTVFYEGSISTCEDFLCTMKGANNHLYVLDGNSETYGFVWLNRFEGRAAHLHFCTFKNIWGSGLSVGIGKKALLELINLQDKKGNYFFDLFVGWLPLWNAHAINFVHNCGAKKLGVVPNAVFNKTINRSESACFVYFTREGCASEDI